MYLLIIAMVVYTCIVGEIRYRIKLKKLPNHLLNRADEYLEAIPITILTVLGGLVIMGMINTWTDPL